MLIFELSKKGRTNQNLHYKEPKGRESFTGLPENLLRHTLPALPEVSELQIIRHYTNLSYQNFSIDSQFYPLGSCTMKYNPRAAHKIASLPGFLSRHPLAQLANSQGFMECIFELQEYLKAITGMSAVSLSPMAGAQGELAGVLMIRAYHRDRGEAHRDEMLVPDSAHGTNPATAVMCGYKVKELPTDQDGNLNLHALEKSLGPKTAGIMLTNPSTMGVFEKHILEISERVHRAGGLLYYDGANLNAIIGKVKPASMGFDVMHLNLHKTFSTPHGGGGPGAGPVAVNDRLLPYLPIPRVGTQEKNYIWLTEKDCPDSIGRLSAFMGNANILLRAYCYIRLLGRQGLPRVAEFACLNANYVVAELKKIGLKPALPNRLAAHEFVITFKEQAKREGVTALDFAKRILDFGCHAPTTYFPLLVPECWLIEPTETESQAECDHFVTALKQILIEAKQDPNILKNAPHNFSVSRLDEVKAARQLEVGENLS